MTTFFRIRFDAKPHGGKVLEATSVDDERATGRVRMSTSPRGLPTYASSERSYPLADLRPYDVDDVRDEEHRFTVDGAEVLFRRRPIRRHAWNVRDTKDPVTRQPLNHPREQTLYEASVDGAAVALVWRPHGFGTQSWRIDRLGERYGHMQGLGDETLYGGHHSHAETMSDLAGAARKVVELRREKRWGGSPKLMTTEEIEAFVAAHAAAEERREREGEETRAKYDREIKERRRREREERLAVKDGLATIHARVDALGLTNLERHAVFEALRAFTRSDDPVDDGLSG